MSLEDEIKRDFWQAVQHVPAVSETAARGGAEVTLDDTNLHRLILAKIEALETAVLRIARHMDGDRS